MTTFARKHVSLLFVVATLAAAACGKPAAAPQTPTTPAAQVAPAPEPVAAPATPAATAKPAAEDAAPADVAAPPADAQRSDSGLATKLLAPGTGAVHPQPQDEVTVHYTGWTTDGKKFDSSLERGVPATFPLRGVIPGWTEGLQLMVVGEKRRLWIPKELAYNDRPGMPAGMLVFDVELLEIEPGLPPIPAPAPADAPPADAKRDKKSGLAWKITQKGTGKAHPSPQAHARLQFTAWDSKGTMLQSTRGEPGSGEVAIDQTAAAWKEMLPQMVVGEKRLVWATGAQVFDLVAGSKAAEPVVVEFELLSFIDPPPVPKDVAQPPKKADKTPSGLASRVLRKGTGKARPSASSIVEVHYTGWTTDGKLFDSSILRGKSARFPLNAVIPGWTEGVQLMVVGEQRRLWIPEDLAYKGAEGPPKGMLVFDVELLAIDPTTPAPEGGGAEE